MRFVVIAILAVALALGHSPWPISRGTHLSQRRHPYHE